MNPFRSLLSVTFVVIVAFLDLRSLVSEESHIQSVEIQKAEGTQITVNANGDGLDSLSITLTLTADRDIKVQIPAGTQFISNNGSVQNMVVVAYKEVALTRVNRSVKVSLEVACAQMGAMIPRKNDTFQVDQNLASGDLQKLLSSSHFQKLGLRERQFAVWTITDNPPIRRYVGIGILGFGTPPNAQELYTIGLVFMESGINVRKYNAFRQFNANKVHLGLKDAERLGFVTTILGNEMNRRVRFTIKSNLQRTVKVELASGDNLIGAWNVKKNTQVTAKPKERTIYIPVISQD